MNFSRDDPDVSSLEEGIFQYAQKNLAVVNVYIKDPVVTRILRDQKIPVISFVANTGGLLGLCMGFSLVSIFEVVYHLLGAIYKWWRRAKEGTTTEDESVAAAPERSLAALPPQTPTELAGLTGSSTADTRIDAANDLSTTEFTTGGGLIRRNGQAKVPREMEEPPGQDDGGGGGLHQHGLSTSSRSSSLVVMLSKAQQDSGSESSKKASPVDERLL